MPEPAETMDAPAVENPTLGPVRSGRRRPKLDETLAAARETAREALLESVDPAELGEHVSAVADDDRVVTHRFVAQVRGYRGWEWFCTLARAPRSKTLTICELGMLPGEGALLSPPWVPWSERASEEERVRLRAIAEGKDPDKALAELRGETDDADVADTQDEHSEKGSSKQSSDSSGQGKKKNKSKNTKNNKTKKNKKQRSTDAADTVSPDSEANADDDPQSAKKAAKAAKKKAAKKKAKKKAAKKAERQAEQQAESAGNAAEQ